MVTTRSRDSEISSPPLPEAARIQQAVDALFDNYNKDPFVTAFFRRLGFFRRHVVSPTATKEQMRKMVKDSLLGGGVPLPLTFDGFVEDLDKLQLTGPQHVAFFQLPKSSMLTKLRDEVYIRHRLELSGWSDCFNKRHIFWLPEKMTLAAVTFERDKALRFEWIEPRLWFRYLGMEVDPRTGELRKTWEQCRERSANFVRFDLGTGDSEVMIQRLRSNPERKADAEIDSYCHLMVSLLGFDPFLRVPLEPAVRHLLSNGVSEVGRWGIDLGGASLMEGRAGRSTFKSVQIEASFKGRLLYYNWRLQPGHRRRVRLQVDGRADLLTIVHPCVPNEHAKILVDIREAAVGAPPPPALKGVRQSALKVSLK